MRKRFLFILLFLLVVWLSPTLVLAQMPDEYLIANQYLMGAQYEKALPYLKQVYEREPNKPQFFERYLDCLFELKQYDTAQNLLKQTKAASLKESVTFKYIELFFYKNEIEKADQKIDALLAEERLNYQTYYRIGRLISEHGHHQKAIEVFQTARKKLNSTNVFAMDIALAAIKNQQYGLAANELVHLIKSNPRQKTYIQRILSQFNSDILSEECILLCEAFINNDTNVSHKSFEAVGELLEWLYLELDLNRKALFTAEKLESVKPQSTYVWNLSDQLKAIKEYDLAHQAYQFYSSKESHPLKLRAIEQDLELYELKASQLGRSKAEQDSLYNMLVKEAGSFLNEYPNYYRRQSVYMYLAEVKLKYLDQFDEAKDMIEGVTFTNSLLQKKKAYLLGRYHLNRKEYALARVQFTRAYRFEANQRLDDEIRYFASLSDLFSDDYEFAKLQLQDFSARTDSYYANEALELRKWFIDGISQDSVANPDFSFLLDAVQLEIEGKTDSAIVMMTSLADSASSPFNEFAFLKLSQLSTVEASLIKKYWALYKTDAKQLRSPDLLLWQIYLQIKEREDQFSDIKTEDVLEQILLKYPNSYYTPDVRKALNQLIAS